LKGTVAKWVDNIYHVLLSGHRKVCQLFYTRTVGQS